MPRYSVNLRAAGNEFERQHIAKHVSRNGGDKAAAARAMGISLSTLYRKMEDVKTAPAPTELGYGRSVQKPGRAKK